MRPTHLERHLLLVLAEGRQHADGVRHGRERRGDRGLREAGEEAHVV
jgi:hypothetical protein